MWLYLLIIAFVVIWILVYYRTPEGKEESEGYEWMEGLKNSRWFKKKKKRG